ncbi:ATP-binding protein [bacterium]|nr:ATP-binding protein [bacterium]
MNLETKKNIAEKVAAYIKSHDLRQSSLANRVGVPKEYLTSILRGIFTYDAGKGNVGDIPERHFKKLAELVDFSLEKQYWKNRATPQLTQMIAILEEAKQHAYTRLIIGETGSGKSHTLELYAKKNPSSVFFVKVGSEDTLNILLDKVAKVLRVPLRRHKSQKIRDISMTLESLYLQGKTPQLIFDESEYLKVSALCSIKEFYDYLDKHCSIVLIGTNQLTDQIDKLRRKDARGIPQLYRRIKFGVRRLPSIDKTFKQFLNEIEDRQLVRFLQTECANYGELHDVLVPCMREADRIDEPLTLNFVKKILNFQQQVA